MTCPECLCLGALVGLARVDCVNRKCRHYYAPARRDLDELGPGADFAGDSVFWIRRGLFLAEKESSPD